MESSKIKVTVIMPVYNSGKYLSTAIESILKQNLKELELILVDDGSTDGSSELCDEYAQKDTRVIVIHQKNGGICNARNTALKIAKGEYIAFSDHDDEYCDGYLEHAYREAIANNADLVKVGKIEYIIKNNHILRSKYSKLPYHIYNQDAIKKSYFQLVNSAELDCLWDGLFKKKVIEEHNMTLNENFKYGGEDIEFIQRFICHVNTFITIDKIYYIHYIRKGFSTSTKFNMDKIQTLKSIVLQMLNTIKNIGIDINQHKFEFSYLLLRQYIAPICSIYSNSNCPISKYKKIQAIKALKKESFYYKFCNEQSIFSVFRISKKYGLLYFLFKYGMYSTILDMYKKRNEQF